jgi:hypothetical protein
MSELQITDSKFVTLRRSHLVAGVLHWASSFALIGLTENRPVWTPPLELAWDKWVPITGNGCNDTLAGRCFEQERVIETYGIHLQWLCFVFAFWSGLVHFYVYFMPQVYLDYINAKFGFFRWVDYMVSAPIMIVVIAIYCGIVNTWSLALLGVTEAVVIVFGVISEWCLSKAKSVTDEFHRLAYNTLVVGFAVFALMWVPQIATFYYSITHATTNVPWIVHIVVWAFPFSFAGFGVVAIYNYRTNSEQFLKYEAYYVLLSLLTKVLLHWSIFFSLLQRSVTLGNSEFERGDPGSVNENGLYALIGSVVVVGVAWFFYYRKKFKDITQIEAKTVTTGAKDKLHFI